MKSLIQHLSRDKKVAMMLLVSSLIIGVCALAPALFVIIVLNKYLASGITATLISLTIGAILALGFEFAFRQNRSKGFFYNDNEYFNGDEPSTFLEEERKPLRDNGSIFTNLGIEFYLKENTSLILSGFYRDRKGDSETKNDIKQTDSSSDLISSSNRVENETDDDKSYQFSANFDSELDDKGQKITLVAQFEKSKEDEDGSIENKILFPEISEISYERVKQYEDQNRTLIQGDYVLPIDENTQFEIGYRGSFLNQETDYEVSYLDQGTFRVDSNLSNVLLYKAYINAAYTQYGKKLINFLIC